MLDSDLPGDWGQYRKLILSELQRISQDLKDLGSRLDTFRDAELSQIKIDVAMLKVKAGVWGGMSGLLVAIAAILVGMWKG